MKTVVCFTCFIVKINSNLRLLSSQVSFASPISKHNVFGREIYLKRDDLITNNLNLRGNKARKLMYFFKNQRIPIVASYGGVQSNSMLALAKCSNNSFEFVYFVSKIPSILKDNPFGNFKEAINLGMKVSTLIYSHSNVTHFYERGKGSW